MMNFMLCWLWKVKVEITFSVICETPARTQYSNANHAHSDEHQHGRAEPKKECIFPHRWFHKHKGAIAGYQEVLDVVVGFTTLNFLTNQASEVGGQSGVGFIDGLTLADEAAQLLLHRLGAGLQDGIGKRRHEGAL